MSCFLACFGGKDHGQRTNHFISSSIPPPTKVNQDSLATRKKLGSFFLSDEFEDKKFHSEPVEKSTLQDVLQTDNLYAELRDEAKFLKSCGALLQTPAEIRKASAYKTAQDVDGVCSNSSISWHCDGSVKKLFWDDQPGEASNSPAQEQKSSQLRCYSTNSCEQEAHHSSNLCDSSLPLSSKDEAMSFVGTGSECVNEQQKNENPEASPPKNAWQVQPFASEYSPFATPQKLTDEMETPATVYPSNIENAKSGRNARIRTQYVFPVKKLEDNKISNLESSSDINDKILSRSAKSEVVVESLSQWLKPVNEARRMNFGTPEKSDSGKNSNADRPIIGMVAAHWNDSEPDNRSIKWWDGNGIPNSTNKYKEDQKVSWHATPFEERLEKALSDENLFPQRKFLCGKLVQFVDENELSDTAAS